MRTFCCSISKDHTFEKSRLKCSGAFGAYLKEGGGLYLSEQLMRECNFLIFLVLNFQPVTGEDQHGILFEVGALKGFNESERDKGKLFVT